MAKFQRCPEEVKELARDLLFEFPTHKPLIDARVSIDYVFAYSTTEDGCALKNIGLRALGLCRVVPLKDRALGRADAEISLDGDWWEKAPPEERRAVLDHELHHILITDGKRDDLGRPVLTLRKHDVEFGWFACIAKRHGEHSQERQQAKFIMDRGGQYFWPELCQPDIPGVAPTSNDDRAEMQRLMRDEQLSYQEAKRRVMGRVKAETEETVSEEKERVE